MRPGDAGACCRAHGEGGGGCEEDNEAPDTAAAGMMNNEVPAGCYLSKYGLPVGSGITGIPAQSLAP